MSDQTAPGAPSQNIGNSAAAGKDSPTVASSERYLAESARIDIAHLRRELAAAKDEIDALQVSVTHEARPWWQHAPNWMSILALLASVVIAIVQVGQNAEQRDLQTKQGSIQAASELTNVMTQISATQRARLSAGQDPDLTKRYNAQILLWAYKASDILHNWPNVGNAAEYYLLANVFADEIGPAPLVIKYLRESMKRATDLRTYSFAAQVLAEQYYSRGENQDAEKVLRQAVNPKPKIAKSVSLAQRLDEILYTHLVWASQLRIRHQCDESRSQLSEAIRLKDQIAHIGSRTRQASTLKAVKDAYCVADRS